MSLSGRRGRQDCHSPRRKPGSDQSGRSCPYLSCTPTEGGRGGREGGEGGGGEGEREGRERGRGRREGREGGEGGREGREGGRGGRESVWREEEVIQSEEKCEEGGREGEGGR